MTRDPSTLVEVRPITLPSELIDSLRLRYDVYYGLGYIVDSDVGLDVDEYDECALALGAFDGITRELVGTLRVLSIDPRPRCREVVRRVVVQAACPALSARVTQPRVVPLPSITSDRIARGLRSLNVHDLPILEMSRCIVRPDRRGAGISRALVELGMGLAWHPGPALLIGGCLPEHVPMYARYGFRALHAGSDYFSSVGRDASVLVCVPEDVPAPTRSRMELLVKELDNREGLP